MYALTEVSAEEKSAFLWDGGEKVPVITVQQETGEGQMKSGKVSANEPHRNDAAGTALQVPNSSIRSGKTARTRLSERKMKSSIANAVRQQGGGQRGREPEATNTDIMASMANSLAGFTSFKFTTSTADSEEEEEVHNAWGEDDTEDNLLDRVHDLEQARGIALGPARSAARMRRARKNKRDKPAETAGRSSPRPIEGSNADTLTAASSIMTNMFNSFATSVSFNVTQAKPSGIDATELFAASTSEMPTASMAVPMLQPQSAGRERFRRRKDRLDPASSTCSKDRQSSLTASQGTESHVSSQGQLQGLLDTTSPARQRLARRNLNAFTVTVKQEETSNSQNRSTFLAAAASSLVEFQKLFQTTSEEGETYSIWGPDDTPEQYQQRLNAMERAQREPASSALHDRLMRRRKRRQDQNKQDGLRVRFF